MTTRAEDGASIDVARFFTRGVKFPRLLGTTPDGKKIPGGPYTMLQAVGGLTAFLLTQFTKPLWTNGSTFTELLVIAAVTIGVGYALRHVRAGGRNPASAALSIATVLSQPKLGRLQGRPIRIRRPHLLAGTAVTVPLTHEPGPVAVATPRARATSPKREPAALEEATGPSLPPRRQALPEDPQHDTARQLTVPIPPGGSAVARLLAQAAVAGGAPSRTP
jgi:hypothetical protein